MASARMALQRADADSLAFLRKNIRSMRRLLVSLPRGSARYNKVADWIYVNERESVKLQAQLEGQLSLPL